VFAEFIKLDNEGSIHYTHHSRLSRTILDKLV
jgi:hypothetical protein